MSQVEQVVIVPTYNEEDSIALLLGDLVLSLNENTFLIFVDDSLTDRTVDRIREILSINSNWNTRFHIIRNEIKSGRGHAVRQGMLYARRELNPNRYLEMDSDGSHRVVDAIEIFKNIPTDGYAIGSRYLEGSKIVGWDKSRLVFSRLINKMLKMIFRLKISDWTNGLRGYSGHAVNLLLDKEQINRGFIYLAEEILILHDANVSVKEVPITFKERVAGKSSVTSVELFDSVKGVFSLMTKKRRGR
jgi:dolichol-phosphate mannosyltransferase